MDATVESAQLNVRMSRDVRDAGNRALRSRGYTPAAFVRLVWGRLAQQGEALDELVRVAENRELPNPGDVRPCDAPRCMGAELWREFCASVALDEAALAASCEAPSYDELLRMARVEQFGDGSYE